MKREVLEEFHVDIKVGAPFAVFDYVNEIKGSHSVEIIYFATLTSSPNEVTLNPEDHSEYDWFGEEELDEVVAPKMMGLDDPEFKAIHRAFILLRGDGLDTA